MRATARGGVRARLRVAAVQALHGHAVLDLRVACFCLLFLFLMGVCGGEGL